MTYKEAYDLTNDWKRRVFLISFFHNTRKVKMKTWRMANTARYFDRSVSIISESLMLIEHWDLVKNCTSRNDALKRLRNGNLETA